MDAQHLPVPGLLVTVSGQLRPFLAKLVVTLVALGICTGESSQLIGVCVLPCALFGGDMGLHAPGSLTLCLWVPQHHPGVSLAPKLGWTLPRCGCRAAHSSGLCSWSVPVTLWGCWPSPETPSTIHESILQPSLGRQYRGVCLFNEAGLGAALLLAQGARDGARAVKEPVPEREPAAGRGGEGPLIPPGYRSPPARGAGKPTPRAESSAEGRDPVGAEQSLQPLCHPPPPGKGWGWGGGGGESGTTVTPDPVGILQFLGAPGSHSRCRGSPGSQEG